MQVNAAALKLNLVKLALAVLLAPGLEGQDLHVPGKVLQLGEQLSYSHATQGNCRPRSVRPGGDSEARRPNDPEPLLA
jgi:hypothetical protein